MLPSAEAVQCGEAVTEVRVETGPHFGGKISVEDSEDDAGCWVAGDRSSPNTSYSLAIDHARSAAWTRARLDN